MDQTFSHLGPYSGLLTYVDDILLCSHSWDHHLSLMENMLKALSKAGLTLKPNKIRFGCSQVKYLGYIVSPQGVSIGNDRIQSMVDLPQPSNIKELRSVLGSLNFVRCFIRNFSDIVEPLVQ